MWIKRTKGLIKAFSKTFRSTLEVKSFLKKHPNAEWNAPSIQNTSYRWSSEVLSDLNIKVKVIGSPTQEPAIYVGNHVSYLDILALFSQQHLCFVSKAEVGEWPIVGPAAKSVGTLMVQRGSTRSKQAIAEAIQKAVRDEKKSVCIFPEGTTSVSGKIWRAGAFRIAEENDLWIQPVGFVYNPMRRAAYIDDDTLVTHMWNLIQKEPVELTLKYFEARKIKNANEDMKVLEEEVQTWVKEQLHLQGHFSSDTLYIE